MFKYNGKIWNPKNPEKKLKQLGITWDDVEIIEEQKKEKKIEYEDPNRLYYYINKKTGWTLSSIYSSIEEMKKHDVAKNKQWYDDYERLSEG